MKEKYLTMEENREVFLSCMRALDALPPPWRLNPFKAMPGLNSWFNYPILFWLFWCFMYARKSFAKRRFDYLWRKHEQEREKHGEDGEFFTMIPYAVFIGHDGDDDGFVLEHVMEWDPGENAADKKIRLDWLADHIREQDTLVCVVLANMTGEGERKEHHVAGTCVFSPKTDKEAIADKIGEFFDESVKQHEGREG